MTAIHYLIDVFSGIFDANDILDEQGLHVFILVVEIGIGLYTVFYCARSPHFKERYEGLIHALAVGTVIKFLPASCWSESLQLHFYLVRQQKFSPGS
jgi:hypothetical protein